ncbi:MAG: MltA domain-containing protein [Geminicoccaceae bacterium]
MGLLLLLAACGKPPPPPPMAIEPVAFEDLAGWADDRQDLALASFLLSCAPLLRRDPEARSTRAEPAAGRNADWQALCRQAAATPVEPAAARAFFEDRVPALSRARRRPERRPLHRLFRAPAARLHPAQRHRQDPLQGSTRRYRDRRSRPLLRRPRRAQGPGLVTGDRLEPYPSRGEIERGALDGRDLELLWVDDPIEKFFLQIQGSGLVELDDGRTLRVGYADQNGRAYRAIGRDLIEMGELTKEEVSLQTIEAWLRAHPDRAQEIMDKNPSYVFFRVLGEAEALLGPEGAQGVPLQAERSLAVDRSFIPLGAPLWLDTQAPFPDGERPFRQLVIAQDTGGAIKGAVRGDVFWGAGDLAAFVAGHMKSRGSYYLLLPRTALPVS